MKLGDSRCMAPIAVKQFHRIHWCQRRRHGVHRQQPVSAAAVKAVPTEHHFMMEKLSPTSREYTVSGRVARKSATRKVKSEHDITTLLFTVGNTAQETAVNGKKCVLPRRFQ
eukprot:CAMPEP_0174869882 /NCGR_PEP_ID=MMETSP1114-20130205/68689_1 /TAXON_ID=312471 /ORGANISM="Neobodo designis, Strain CCAP 1951/1" /LENGTH=111 /DNA_ID=CAMNT_0016105143 /DNA_START=73 /DNA_END=406 /DNA_ORIENTATION=+